MYVRRCLLLFFLPLELCPGMNELSIIEGSMGVLVPPFHRLMAFAFIFKSVNYPTTLS